jgi:hypothetical protein
MKGSNIILLWLSFWALIFAMVFMFGCSPAYAIDVTQPPYNVVCNGTTDNAAGLQAALDSLCPDGDGELQLPATGICRINSPIKARCLYGLTIIGNENAPGAVKPVIRYTGPGPRAVDIRGVMNFRSTGVAYEIANSSFTGSLIDATATNTCANNGLRACDTNADCQGSTCDTNVNQWASNLYFDLGSFSAPCTETGDVRLLWVRHVVNLNLDRNVLMGGSTHIYGVDNNNEWTSVINLTRNYFYTAGKVSLWNLRWATNMSGNFWQPQGCNSNHTRAFDRAAGVTVEGFYSHGDSFWDVGPSEGFTETMPWIAISGRNINISSRFESMSPTPIAQAVKLDGGASNGVSITGSYCKNLAQCWNLGSKAHKNVSIMGNGYNNAGATIVGAASTSCPINTANTLVCD